MENNSRFQNRLITPTLSILFAAGLLPLNAASASDQNSNRSGAVDNPGSSVDLSRSLLARTSALWSNPQWQEFKRIWKKLNNMEQADVNHSSSDLDYETIDKIRTELDNSYVELMGIAEEIGIDSLDIGLLHKLATDRLTFLSYGSMFSLTRMMPPPVSEQTDYLVSQIEARLDTVIRLREEGLISSGEMITAFSNLRSSIDTYFLLETVSERVGYAGVLWSVRWPLEADLIPPYLDSIKTAVLDSLENSGVNNEEERCVLLEDLEDMERSISRTRDRLPALHDLLLDLELF
ncbi:MAG: hypothetical protein K8S15_08200 [Candidatus Aegiribacteria sp.]|nr:hypothetical protein [Candidatus Aegiribacteria sp.]